MMGKRSDFARRPADFYPTPYQAAVPLIPHLSGVRTFAELCCGDGDLARHLESFGLECVFANDVALGLDSLFVKHCYDADAIITNPPWSRDILHPLIQHFQHLAPTWLLLDADWAHTKQAAPYLPQCSHIVAIGRVKWIPDSKHTGKDNCAWYRFDEAHAEGPRFIGREQQRAA